MINLLLNRTRARMQQGIDITNKNADEDDQGRGSTGKLRSQWKDAILPKKADNTTVYNIKPENCNNVKTKRGHRNIIVPCNLLSANENNAT